MALEQSYTSTPSGSPQGGTGPVQSKQDYWPLQKLKKAYTDYLFNKRQERDEQIDGRRYYHGSQYTAEQLRVLKNRRQPAMTFNRIARKIDGVVGLIEKLRQDPKAYARTPQHAEGADLATAALRYVLDEQEWKAKSPQCASDGAVDGIGGIELGLIQGDQGDPEIGLEIVDTASFFYDPRSYKEDFSDAEYMGVGKWLTEDKAKQLVPDADEGLFSGHDFELLGNSDREMRWFSTDGPVKRVRVVECWYQHKGGWCYAIFTGSGVLTEGASPFKDEKGKAESKYHMFSGNVDQDGDRYGFVRNMKSAQDGINAKQSKMQHMLASKRLILSQGAVDDVEKVRTEWARPDGVVITNRPVNEGVKTDDQSFDFAGLEKLLTLNIQEIENFGPNRTLLGDGGVDSRSGRAIALLEQAGQAELGPYMSAYKGWKLRVYRGIWNAVQQHWKAERWVRVTDDQQLAQYIQINGLQIGPDGKPTLVNAIGSLDVDIIMDEGPDTVNSMQDVYETLSNVLPSIAPVLSPSMAQSVVDILIKTSPLPADIKKKFSDKQEQDAQQQGPSPEEQKMQAEMQFKQAELQMDQQAKAADLEIERQKLSAEIEFKRAELEIEAQKAQAKINADTVAANQKMELEREKHANDMQMMGQKHQFEIAAANDKRKSEALAQHQDLELSRQKHAQQMNHTQEAHDMKAEDAGEPSKPRPSGVQKPNKVDALVGVVEKLIEAAHRPKRIIRDEKTGRAVGVETVA